MKKLGLAVALAFFAGAFPAVAAVSLIDKGPVTYDPNSGLEWLDLGLTQGSSYNQTLGSSYVANGFRFATATDLQNLYAVVGITN